MEPSPHPPDTDVPPRRYPWGKLALLYATVIAGEIMIVPIARYAGPKLSHQTEQIALLSLLALFAILPLGLAAVPRLGIPGTPLLDRWMRREPTPGALRSTMLRGFVLMLVCFAAASAMLPFRWDFLVDHSPHVSPAFSLSTLPIALLSAVGAGFEEEILYRLGLLSVIVWIVARVTRTSGDVSGRWGTLWVAIIAQAYVFGLMHQALGLTGTVGGFSLVGALVDPRTMVALVLGYATLSYGLETAIATHIFYDASIFVIATLLPFVR